MEETEKYFVAKALEYGKGCKKVFVATSGGVDSSLVAAILCLAYGSENVVTLYRDIKSSSKHLDDVVELQKVFGFKLLKLDANPYYDMLINDLKNQFSKLGLAWCDEFDNDAREEGFTNAYASLKSRFNTWVAGFISKAIDEGQGRIFGTGNGEEDELLRYFDKYGDGAVDNNLLTGLTKAEVRQLALYLGVPRSIVLKTPSADLEGNGDEHNDESQLTSWARSMGYNIDVSYGSCDGSEPGNIAWAWSEDIKRGVIKGGRRYLSLGELVELFDYSDEEIEIISFMRKIENATRHKVLPIPGSSRQELINLGLLV